MADGLAEAVARGLNAVFDNDGFVGAPPVITAENPPDAPEDSVYPTYAFVATGATPISWALLSGATPTGTVFNANGTLTGTPTTPGTYIFAVRATNLFGFDDSGSISLTITAVGGGGITLPNDVTVGVGATHLGYYGYLFRTLEMSDAELIAFRDTYGVTDLVLPYGYAYAGGDYSADYNFTTDTSATFNASDGRQNPGEYPDGYDKWSLMRALRYGSDGRVGSTSGYGNFITRIHALGMRFFTGSYIGSQAGSCLFAGPWADNARWNVMLAPTSGFTMGLAAAHAWGHDGWVWDNEVFGTIPNHAWDWFNSVMGSGNPEATVRADALFRGGQVGALIASIWTTRQCIIKKYQTTGHAGYDGDFDGRINQLGNDPTGNIKQKYVERDFDIGLLASAANIRLDTWSSVFYRFGSNGAVMFDVCNTLAEMSQYAGITRWTVMAPKVTRNVFGWPGHASSPSEDTPNSVPTNDAIYMAGHRYGQEDLGYYYQTGNDNPYAAGMLASTSTVPVSNVAPNFTVAPTVIGGRCRATAQHHQGIVRFKLEVFNAADTAIAQTWYIPHVIVNGTHDWTYALGFDDASYACDGNIPGGVPAGRRCWVTPYSVHEQRKTMLCFST